MAFPDAWRPQKEHVRLLPDVAARRQRLDLAAIDAGLKAPVEILEGLAGGEPRELEHRRHTPLVRALELAREHELEEAERRELFPGALLDQVRETARRIVEA